MVNTSEIRCLFIGEQSDAEVVRSLRSVRDLFTGAAMRTVETITDTHQVIRDENFHPQLIIVAQTWPDQFSEREVLSLLAVAPLARLICHFGPWCVSDGRTRAIWPEATRVATRSQLESRIVRELEVLACRRAPLPLTASRDEIFAYDAIELPQLKGTTTAIVSPDRELRTALRDALETSEARVVDSLDHDPLDCVLWDVDPSCEETAERLRDFTATHPTARCIALVGWPDDGLIRKIEGLGFSVCSKTDPLIGIGRSRPRVDGDRLAARTQIPSIRQ